jgi:hypothetical protein
MVTHRHIDDDAVQTALKAIRGLAPGGGRSSARGAVYG